MEGKIVSGAWVGRVKEWVKGEGSVGGWRRERGDEGSFQGCCLAASYWAGVWQGRTGASRRGPLATHAGAAGNAGLGKHTASRQEFN